jgi:hypothetical protein
MPSPLSGPVRPGGRVPRPGGVPAATGQHQRAGAQGQPVPGQLDPPLLVVDDPVGKQRQLHMVDDPVAKEAVAAGVGDKPSTARACSWVLPPSRSPAANPGRPGREMVTEKRPSAL